MINSGIADAIVLLHLAFIVFVLLGGWLALRWRWLLWLHIPAVAWGCAVEFLHLYCPLTVWENHFRALAGKAGYADDFIQHYILNLIYPSGLTPQLQIVFGAIVVVINVLAYILLLRRYRHSSK